jgi:hypothetical protein
VELAGGKLTKTRQVIDFWHAKIDSLLDEFARLDEIEARLKA